MSQQALVTISKEEYQKLQNAVQETEDNLEIIEKALLTVLGNFKSLKEKQDIISHANGTLNDKNPIENEVLNLIMGNVMANADDYLEDEKLTPEEVEDEFERQRMEQNLF